MVWIPFNHIYQATNFVVPDLSQRVDSVKEENLKLRSENQVLSQYIENLMSASSVFQSTSPNTKKKWIHAAALDKKIPMKQGF